MPGVTRSPGSANRMAKPGKKVIRFWRDGRAAEGAPLLREYGFKKPIEGSNPSLSARHNKARLERALLCLLEGDADESAGGRRPRVRQIRRERIWSPQAPEGPKPGMVSDNPSLRPRNSGVFYLPERPGEKPLAASLPCASGGLAAKCRARGLYPGARVRSMVVPVGPLATIRC